MGEAGESGHLVRQPEAAAVDAERRSLTPQIVTLAVFTAIASTIVVTAKLASQTPVEWDDAEPEAAATAGPTPRNLTPATARSARELNAALLARFGTNRRGMAFVTVVDYDAHADRLHISYPLDEADVAAPTAQAAGLKRARDLLESLSGSRMKWTWVLLTATAPARDESGHAGECTVIRLLLSRDRLGRVDRRQFGDDDLKAAAEQFWLHPDLGK